MWISGKSLLLFASSWLSVHCYEPSSIDGSGNNAATTPKVRVNILYLSADYDMAVIDPTTFRNSTNVNYYASEQLGMSDPAGYSWIGNARLKNIEVHVKYRFTNYAANSNLQQTFATLLELLLAQKNTCTVPDSSKNQTEEAADVPAVHLIVGPGYSAEAKAISQLTSFYNLAMISGSATSPLLADRSRYANFFRTCPSDGDVPDVMVNILSYFGYNQLTTVYQEEGYLLDLRDMLEPRFRARSMQVENSFVFYLHNNETYFHIANILGHTAQSHVWLLSISTSFYELLCALYHYGQVRGSTHLALMFGTMNEWKYLPPTQATVPNYTDYLYLQQCTQAQIMEIMQGSLHLEATDADYLDREADMVGIRPSKFRKDVVNALVQTNRSEDNFAPAMYYFFDAVSTAALVLDRTESDLNRHYNTSLAYFHYNDTRVLKNIYAHLLNVSFQGLTGPVEFSSAGDRARNGWTLKQFQGTKFVDVARYEATNATSYNMSFFQPLMFPTTDGKPPPQFRIIEPWTTTLNITLVVVAATLVILSIPASYLYMRRRSDELALRAALGNTERWLLEPSALVADNGGGGGKSLMMRSTNATSSVSVASVATTGVLSRGSGMWSNGGAGGTYGRAHRPFDSYKYKDSPVSAFGLQRSSNTVSSSVSIVDREFATLLLSIQTLSQSTDNLSRFIGTVLLQPSTTLATGEGGGGGVASMMMHVVMASSAKGTLYEFLLNSSEEMELDEPCSFSFIRDLHKGLTEIHNATGYHGRLSSTVCIIDNRLSLRISDYGFGPYRQARFYSPEANIYENWLWSAPEILRTVMPSTTITLTAPIMPMTTTKTKFPTTAVTFADQSAQPLSALDWCKCDIYAMGIIGAEIFSRLSPFQEQLESQDITTVLQNIALDGKNPAVEMWRPVLLACKVPSDVMGLALSCLQSDPIQRPTMAAVGTTLRTMMKSRKLSDNLTEMLMQRLETYANNLASLVEQRTQALAEEEMKVRRLLYQILPPSVADALKNGENIPPQTYESVSIYFRFFDITSNAKQAKDKPPQILFKTGHDIVGFTTISAQSTPLQVVDLLNDLYNSFDQIISKFDVYKVETIGDAYMVVSGLPKPNGLEHVRCIALMASALIDLVTNDFKIRHQPNEQLRLRIGMHTGGCAAGVVGFVMPRYCLFGDTVNTASRMESTGEALRIHASQVSVGVLCEMYRTEFSVELRGDVEVKGKGLMTTYWVTKATNRQLTD